MNRQTEVTTHTLECVRLDLVIGVCGVNLSLSLSIVGPPVAEGRSRGAVWKGERIHAAAQIPQPSTEIADGHRLEDAHLLKLGDHPRGRNERRVQPEIVRNRQRWPIAQLLGLFEHVAKPIRSGWHILERFSTVAHVRHDLRGKNARETCHQIVEVLRLRADIIFKALRDVVRPLHVNENVQRLRRGFHGLFPKHTPRQAIGSSSSVHPHLHGFSVFAVRSA
jgi:hypothetical protein